MKLSDTKTANDTALALSILRQQAGYYSANEYGLLAISGKDAVTYLQSQSSNDINKLQPGHGQFTCILDRKAHVLAYFHLFKDQNILTADSGSSTRLYVVAEKEQLPGIVAHLEQFRFAAQVEFADISSQGKFIAIAGPRCNQLLYQLGIEVHLTELPELDICDIKCGEYPIRVFRHSTTGDSGYFLWVQETDYTNIYKSITDAAARLNFAELKRDVIETARIEAGLTKFGLDFGPENLLPETGLETSTVSYTKGCFAGQEVLARVKSHGLPAKALIGLVIEKEKMTIQRNSPDKSQNLPINSSILVSGEEIGILKSNTFSPALDKSIAFAFLKRDYRIPDKKFAGQIGQESITASVTIPPFIMVSPGVELARRLYEQAVQAYIKEATDAIPIEIITLLKEALAFDPKLEDAYEALAVILGKHDRLDEAIALMKKLAQLNPDSVMAHSNLSQFHVQQGNKELAEEEKAIALGIRMRLAAAEAMAQTKQKDEAHQDIEETKRRMSMFEQVLAIDSKDFFANAGLGECLVEMKEYQKAIPYLKTAIEMKPLHSPAYLALATAYQESDSNEQAKAVLTEGIAIATKRGDIPALQQMQDRLANTSNVKNRS